MKARLFVLPAALFVSFGRLMQADENALATPESTPASATNAVQRQEPPQWVLHSFSANNLNTQYDFAFTLQPSYLTADFNHDGKIDVGVLVKQRSTGKLGTAIVHGATSKVTILGAGRTISNGGDDWKWMDAWQVYSKRRGAHAADESNVPRLEGDAILVSKAEAANALIYWNGKRYVWFQQGD